MGFRRLDVIPTAVALVRSTPTSWSPRPVQEPLAGRAAGRLRDRPAGPRRGPHAGQDSFNSYPLDRLALVGASAAMDDEAWFETTRRRSPAARPLAAGTAPSASRCCRPPPTSCFARHPAATPPAGRRAAERSIIVRHFKAARIDHRSCASRWAPTPSACSWSRRCLQSLG